MKTKDCFLPVNGKHDLSGTSDDRYGSLNLNRKHHCLSVVETVHAKDFSNNTKKVQNYDLTHDTQKSKSSHSRKKSENKLSSEYLNIYYSSDKNEYKEGKDLKVKSKNDSTLSLHIAAYENSIEAAAAESEGIYGNKDKFKVIKSLKDFKHMTLSSAINNPFEFPRWQTDDTTDPAVMQFSASQQLLNPNQGNEAMSDLYKDHNLTDEEISRYGRQMITADFDVRHQEKLKNSAVLVVGCGGLGNPVALYLAGAGIGKLGLVDFDSIDISNIHRQIGFTVEDVGKKKSEILKAAVLARNPNVEVEIYDTMLNKDNAMEIIKDYTVVADCSDNMPTRYTVNEACLLTHTPLAMGSAVGWAGQFTFYHINLQGACYRCLYPNPSKNTINMSCNEKGIMGPVVGIIGNIQAIEIIKFCAFGESSFSDTMYNYDAFDGRFFNVKLRAKSPNCESCIVGLTKVNDYVMLCDRIAGQTPLSGIIPEDYRVTSKELLESLKNDQDAVLIDVRPINEFKIAHHPRATNIPINEFSYEKGGLQTVMHLCKKSDEEPPNKCFLICRRGNDSYRVLLLLKARFYGDKALDVVDVVGGYDAWRKDVDPCFPVY